MQQLRRTPAQFVRTAVGHIGGINAADHLLAVTLQRTGHSRGIASVHPEMDQHTPVVGKPVGHVHINKVCIAIFHRPGQSRTEIITAHTCHRQLRRIIKRRHKMPVAVLSYGIHRHYVIFYGQFVRFLNYYY